MHDTQVEDRLRRVLRTEGDDLPFTVTTAELERRLLARRRAASGRRVSLVAAAIAAVAVAGMVAVSNGWIGMPAVATQPSPSPSPTSTAGPSSPAAVKGLVAIDRDPSEPTLLEVTPRLSDGTTDVFDVDGVEVEQFVTIKLACVGHGVLDLTVGSQGPDVMPCQSEGAAEPAGDPSIQESLVDSTPYRVMVRAPAGIAYTFVVEHVTVPDVLPGLDRMDPGDFVFEATSGSDRPEPGTGGGPVTRVVGSMPAVLVGQVQVVCLGHGSLRLDVGRPGSPTASVSSIVYCNGEQRIVSDGTGNPGPAEILVTAADGTAWHVIATTAGDPPATVPP